ncbi:MAG: hypothetical protein HKP41_08795 [Desulfobacterales bacterium]|nr:hypothetical protein [Deltaproteobacteria bacterium]NNK94432.1 hypothetical protein [Desulfobacterales bacterium]
MKNVERRGSVVTSIMTLLSIFLVLAVFGNSVRDDASLRSVKGKQSSTIAESYDVGAGFYQIHVLPEAEQDFIPDWQNLD